MTDKIIQLAKKLLPFFLIAESISFIGHYFYSADAVGFLITVIFGLYLGWKKLDYLIALAFAELAIGSKGYLFVLNIGSFHLSIRMALWLSIMVIWGIKFLQAVKRSDNKKAEIGKFLLPSELKIFIPLLLIAAFAVLNGYLHSNTAGNIYSDSNAWLYFLLLWPISTAVRSADKKSCQLFASTLTAAIAWLTIKSWLLLYFFAHAYPFLENLYKWVRNSGVGEITAIPGSFYRIFIQSHIYALAALVVAWFYLWQGSKNRKLRELINDKKYLILLISSSALLSVILIGLSRSFWVSLFAIFLFIAALTIVSKETLKSKILQLGRWGTGLFLTLLLSLFFLFILIKFPLPNNTIGFDAASVLSNRATETNEAAIGSRWALLPVLSEAIGKNWLIGQGFGTTVTYYSQDPRVVKATGGAYTTFAFEWGWLDLWLKLGLLGVLAYLYIFYSLWSRTDGSDYQWPLRLILLMLAAVHIFTPYLNHPLGIGIIMIIAFLGATSKACQSS